MSAITGFSQFKLTAANDDQLAVKNVLAQDLLDVHQLRYAVSVESHHVDWKINLEFGELIEFVEDNFGLSVFFEVNGDLETVAIGVIIDILDADDFFSLDQFHNAGNDFITTALIRNGGGDNLNVTFAVIHNFCLGAVDNSAFASAVNFGNRFFVKNEAARREIWTLDIGHNFFKSDVADEMTGDILGIASNRLFDESVIGFETVFVGRLDDGSAVDHLSVVYLTMLDHIDDSMTDFGEIMRGNFGSHTDRNAFGAHEQKIWDFSWEHGWLFERTVEVVDHGDGIFVDVIKDFSSDFGHACFSVTHCRGGVAVDTAKVSLTINERVAHIKWLCQADKCHVDGSIAVRMIFTQNVANDTR